MEILKYNEVKGISSDTHDANHLDVASRGVVRFNPPSGICHVTIHVGNVLLKERLKSSTMMGKGEAHNE